MQRKKRRRGDKGTTTKLDSVTMSMGEGSRFMIRKTNQNKQEGERRKTQKYKKRLELGKLEGKNSPKNLGKLRNRFKEMVKRRKKKGSHFYRQRRKTRIEYEPLKAEDRITQ